MRRPLVARVRLRLGLPPSFGDLGGTEPVSRQFGFDRGTPVDRHYIERFLADHAPLIAGRTLEIGDDAYTRRFGGAATTQRDVLHIDPQVPAAFHGDLAAPGILPADTFDCAVITQTLHLIYDMRAALDRLHAALRPGGALLLTVPGISQIAADEWGKNWFWSLTVAAVERLLVDVFGPGQAIVRSWGNVYAATAFLQGLAREELTVAKLDVVDPLYPVLVTAYATRRYA